MFKKIPNTVWIITLLLLSAWVSAGGFGRSVPNPIRGGLLWDKWWLILGISPPAGDHPLYPAVGAKTGPTTFRCKECHGWDYKGVNGAYGSGGHFTGIIGVYGSTMSAADMFDLIKLDTIPNGHGYGNYGVSDLEILNLVEFLQTSLIDTDLYIDANGTFTGDETLGQFFYEAGGPGPLDCIMCHGPDGDWLNFNTPQNPEWIGTIAVHNPWELMHKVRFGQPASPMPSWVDWGGATQSIADLGRYCQLNFPTGLCTQDVTGDGFVNVSDLLEVISQWGNLGGSADVNGDGIVNITDLLSVVGSWGICP